MMIKRWLCAGCIVLFLAASAAAAQAIPGIAESTPVPFQRSMRNTVRIEARYDGKWNGLKSHMVYAREQGGYFDGMLHFVSLQTYIEMEKESIETVQWTPEFDVRVHFSDDVDSGSYGCTLLRKNGEELIPYMDEMPEWTQLEEGLYLLNISHQTKRGDESYSGRSFIWLEV